MQQPETVNFCCWWSGICRVLSWKFWLRISWSCPPQGWLHWRIHCQETLSHSIAAGRRPHFLCTGTSLQSCPRVLVAWLSHLGESKEEATVPLLSWKWHTFTSALLCSTEGRQAVRALKGGGRKPHCMEGEIAKCGHMQKWSHWGCDWVGTWYRWRLGSNKRF